MKYPGLILLTVAISLVACKPRDVAPTAEEHAAILKDAPELFVPEAGERGPGLVGIGNIYLGQEKDAALAELAKICPKTMEYRAGDAGENAWFRGCVLRKSKDGILSVRVGFWPRIGDRVSTLDIKRDDITLEQARERFRALVPEVTGEYPHPGVIEMRAEKYQMLADIDEGVDGPTHVAVGYSKPFARTLESQ
ncbi:hypothetical protein DFR33_101261 [Bradymonas sediminis]|uniref:Uncharacterized protein n=2 Tax=Bradymonas sediminis TaxID=1548548 RepID=A0A2Z4FH40_9DELT|nr:hypothetical protein DN745_02340 [Bradymonas sediminis]TDP77361.1 hypothetical protein DFR33_101261 [Bradymonas sediminis]